MKSNRRRINNLSHTENKEENMSLYVWVLFWSHSFYCLIYLKDIFSFH